MCHKLLRIWYDHVPFSFLSQKYTIAKQKQPVAVKKGTTK